MTSPTIEFCRDNSTNDDSVVFEKESPKHFSALKDYLTRSISSEGSADLSVIFDKERKKCFHSSSNDRTALTAEMSDIESSFREQQQQEEEDSNNNTGDILLAMHDSLHRSSTHLRLSMCGAIHETVDEGDTGCETSNNSTSDDWKSVASSAKDEEEFAGETAEVNQERVIVQRRVSNPLLLGRRSSAHSRRDSVMSGSMQEAFQQVRDTFEPSLARQQQHHQEQDEVSDLDDDDEFGYYDHYEYGDAIPDDKKVVDMLAPAQNRKSSIGHRLESVHHGSMIEAFQQVHNTFEASSKLHQQQQQDTTTDYGYGDAVPDNKEQVDYGYGDAAPDRQPSSTEFTPHSKNNDPPCVFWDVQEEEEDVAKYGYGENHMPSRRQSGAHYDYGYGSDHDMESTWHHGENMGHPSNRVLPHQDPAVTNKQQPSRRRNKQRQNSWNAQEQPRRRVQRRSSVTKYNLEESMAKVQREEEEVAAAAAVAVAAAHPTPRSFSTMGDSAQQQKKKKKFSLVPSRWSSPNPITATTTFTKVKTNSRKRWQSLREIFNGSRRGNNVNRGHQRSSSNTNTTRGRSSGGSNSSSFGSDNNNKIRPEAVPERNSRSRLCFRRGRRRRSSSQQAQKSQPRRTLTTNNKFSQVTVHDTPIQ